MPCIEVRWSRGFANLITERDFRILASLLIEATVDSLKIAPEKVAVREVIGDRTANSAEIEIRATALKTPEREKLVEDWVGELLGVPERLREQPLFSRRMTGQKVEVFCTLEDGAYGEATLD